MLEQQSWSFLVAVFSGIAAGIVFDTYQVGRRLMRLRKWTTFVSDILTSMLISVLVFGLLILGNWAELRVYVIVGVAIGFLSYVKVASKQTQKLVLVTIRAIQWTLHVLVKLIVIPFTVLVRLLGYPAAWAKQLTRLLIRISEYLLSFPQLAISRFYQRLVAKINHPPQR